MDFRLKVFKTVATQLSFTKASKILFISQPAVTKHINALEKQLGCALFNRHGNTISLTAQGEVCLDYAKRILTLYENLEKELSIKRKALPSRIKLAASTTIAQYILPSLLAKFSTAYPDTSVSLVNQNSERIERLVLDKETDLGLVEGITNNPLLHYEPFVKDEIVLSCRIGNRNIRSGGLSRDQLTGIPLILREEGSGTRKVVERELGKMGIDLSSLHIQMELGSTESIKNYLLTSDGFAFISIHAVAKELKDKTLMVIDVPGLEILRTFQFVSRHGDYEQTSEWMKNFLRNHYNVL